jgi:hypothetical protein
MPEFLKTHELRNFKKLLNMESGDVLAFSNSIFKSFVIDSVDKNIYDSQYATGGESKAKRLECFLNMEPKGIAIKLLSDLFDQYRPSAINNRELYEDCRIILERLKQENVLIAADALKKIDRPFVDRQLEYMQERLKKGDTEGVITSSRSLVETVLRSVLEKNAVIMSSTEKANIVKLHKTAFKFLGLDQALKEPTQQIASGLISIIGAIGEMGNSLGDRHGKDKIHYFPQRHHAKLCANLAKSICEFIIEQGEYADSQKLDTSNLKKC